MPYRQDTKFDWPEDLDLCDNGGYDGYGGSRGGGSRGGDAGGGHHGGVDVMEGAFD